MLTCPVTGQADLRSGYSRAACCCNRTLLTKPLVQPRYQTRYQTRRPCADAKHTQLVERLLTSAHVCSGTFGDVACSPLRAWRGGEGGEQRRGALGAGLTT